MNGSARAMSSNELTNVHFLPYRSARRPEGYIVRREAPAMTVIMTPVVATASAGPRPQFIWAKNGRTVVITPPRAKNAARPPRFTRTKLRSARTPRAAPQSNFAGPSRSGRARGVVTRTSPTPANPAYAQNGAERPP